jgi:myo-inositol-1(or 4)-monophosphatase
MGSAAMDLCCVAAGWLDGYWEIRIKPWDIAAGALIVEEAGGKVTKLNGEPDYMQPPYDILACTPNLYELMREVLNKEG